MGIDQQTFRALRVFEEANGFHRRIVERKIADLPPNEVLIRVEYAALNYKDALSANGHKGITRQFPHTPGIDAAGEVVHSDHPRWKKGDKVIVTSYDLGMNTDGGFAEFIRVPGSWIVALPEGMDTRKAMIYGTAGFTAGLALHKIRHNGQLPEQGPILVTGATGGVGSLAIALLKKNGFEVTAATGKLQESEYLHELGADTVIHRNEVNDDSAKPFLSIRWAGAIDTVGGNTLATILKSCGLHGNVAVCGLVQSDQLHTTVYPFIIKGNNLLGIESATCPMELRKKIWQHLATDWAVDLPPQTVTECGLNGLIPFIDKMLQGNGKGRVLVKM